MPFYDSHAHLSVEEVYPDVDKILQRAKEAGVTKILNICIDLPSLEKGLELSNKYDWIQNAAATTPHDVLLQKDPYFSYFESAAKLKKIVAVGETGLDYYYKDLDPGLQKEFLISYLHLAAETKLPVIFHCREAFADLFSIVDQEYPKKGDAILHCFTGDEKEAEEVLARGWHLSLSGIVTFKKSEVLRNVAKMVPLDKLLIETDTPYLAPQSRRGKKNEPAFIQETAALIAEVKGVTIDELAHATYENASRLFSR